MCPTPAAGCQDQSCPLLSFKDRTPKSHAGDIRLTSGSFKFRTLLHWSYFLLKDFFVAPETQSYCSFQCRTNSLRIIMINKSWPKFGKPNYTINALHRCPTVFLAWRPGLVSCLEWSQRSIGYLCSIQKRRAWAFQREQQCHPGCDQSPWSEHS